MFTLYRNNIYNLSPTDYPTLRFTRVCGVATTDAAVVRSHDLRHERETRNASPERVFTIFFFFFVNPRRPRFWLKVLLILFQWFYSLLKRQRPTQIYPPAAYAVLRQDTALTRVHWTVRVTMKMASTYVIKTVLSFFTDRNYRNYDGSVMIWFLRWWRNKKEQWNSLKLCLYLSMFSIVEDED